MRILERFDDRTLWCGAVANAAVSVAMVVVGLALAIARMPRPDLTASWLPQNAFAVLILAPVFLLTARAQPRNRVVWAVGVATLLSGVQVLVGAIGAMWISVELGSSARAYAPADLSLPVATAEWFTAWSWVPIVVLLGPLLLLWFPDGTPPSTRWRPVAATAVGAMVAIVAGLMVVTWPTRRLPYGEALSSSPAESLFGIGYPMLGVATLLAFASVVVRTRTADGVVRQQIRTLGYGATIFGLVSAISLAVDRTSLVFQVTLIPTLAILAAAFAIAIGRYRLFDIDVAINRTLVFGVLAVFITGIYAGIVVGIGSAVGDPSNPLLAIGATALVAVVFEPVRARVQHWANVVAFGRRATPYEVLAGFADQIRQPALEPEEQVTELARLLVDGTGADRAVVWLAVDDRLEPVGVAPLEGVTPAPASSVDALPADASVPVALDGELLGAVTIEARRGGEVSDSDRRLLDSLAGQAALVLGNARLRVQLRQRMAALTESRRRLVAATDEARRRLERDLHDGAQQQLVALKVKLGLARTLAGREDAGALVPAIGHVADQADAVIDGLRDLARGIYPPLLESEGLSVALEAQARKAPLPVVVDVREVGRHPRQIEACVYFCVAEALANVTRHAGATCAHVTVTDDGGTLTFTVTDDGAGFDDAAIPRRGGLLDMADRLDTVDGELRIDSAPGQGTTVHATIVTPTLVGHTPSA